MYLKQSQKKRRKSHKKSKEKRHKKDESEKSKNFSKANSHKCEGKQRSGNLQPSINLLPKYKFQIKKTKSNYYLIKKKSLCINLNRKESQNTTHNTNDNR